MKLSEHFDSREFADHRTGVVHVDRELLRRLELLRARIGLPLRIVSGFRSVETNRAVGGAVNSQHLYGRAADIPSGYARVDDVVWCGFTGIGHCAGWVVHVDVRPGPRRIFEDC